MSQQAQGSGLSEEVRFRVPLPVVVPIGAVVVIAVAAIGFAQILLNVPKEVAVILALAAAMNILGVCTFIALRPETARSHWAELFIVATYPFVIGVVLAGIGLGEGGHSAAPAHGSGGGGGALTVAAEGVAFDTSSISLPAGEEAELVFDNKDTVEHNIAIYADDSADKELFKGQVIPGGQETTYSVPALDKGEYYFRCDVHPAMEGTVEVG